MLKLFIIYTVFIYPSIIQSSELDINHLTELYFQSIFLNHQDLHYSNNNIHYSNYLHELFKHGNKLSPENKNMLKIMGFNINEEFIKTNRPILSNYIDSGLFRYHYTTTGDDAIDSTDNNNNNIPDYLDLVIQTFNDVSTINFDSLKFTKPPSDSWVTNQNNGGSSHYDIYLFNLEPGYYGYVQAEDYSMNNSIMTRGDNENSINIKEVSSMISFMALRNNYSSFSGNIDEILKITIAHEFFHAIQYGYDGWEAGWLLESTAVWMEELHYDHINDCYQFLYSNLEYPEHGLFYDTQRGYGSYTFFSFIENNYLDNNFVKDIFDQAINYYSYDFDHSLNPIIDILDSNALDFSNIISELAISNLLLNSDVEPSIYAFDESTNLQIRSPYICNTFNKIEDSIKIFNNQVLWSTGSNYYKFVNLDSTLNNLYITILDSIKSTDHYTLHSIIQQDTIGNIYKIENTIPQNITLSYQDSLFFAVTYHGGYSPYSTKYSIKFIKNFIPILDENNELLYNYTSLPINIHLNNPYPNPFNDILKIDFSIDKVGYFQLDIYNINGQLIRNLISNNLISGNQSTTWNSLDNNGNSVPSGIYFLILSSPNNSLHKKISLLK